MSAAVAEPTTATTFIAARSHDLVLTRRPVRYRIDSENGAKHPVTFDEWIAQQEDLNFKLVSEGKEPLEIDRTPWKVEFVGGRYKAETEEIAEWLRNHKLFNNSDRGFYEQGKAPDEPKPTLTEQAGAIAEASAMVEIDRLEEILELERSTHNREPILVAAEAALSRIRKLESQTGPGADADGDHEARSAPETPH